VKTTKVDATITKTVLCGLHGKPFTVSMTGRGVDPERIVLGGENG
jgi:hypothetical protein